MDFALYSLQNACLAAGSTSSHEKVAGADCSGDDETRLDVADGKVRAALLGRRCWMTLTSLMSGCR